MAQAEEVKQEHKRLDAQELVGLELSTEEFITLICESVVIELDGGDAEDKDSKCNLPHSVGAIIVSYLRIQNQTAVKVGDELWVRMDSKQFKGKVGYLQASYPWAFKGRPLSKDDDAYLEGLEIWERYRQKYDLIDGFGSVLQNGEMKILKMITEALPNRAKKHERNDLVTQYGTYHLFYSFGCATRDIIGSGPLREKDFEAHWEMYGDNVENLANHLTTEEINEWRPSVDKICHFKQQLLPEIKNALFPPEIRRAKIRKIHLSTDSFRDRTKYIYDIFVGQKAVLFQRVHSD